MSHYDDEAATYDETRGGVARARAAADAVTELLPADSGGVALDVAGGTGIIAAELAWRGWSVLVADRSRGMLQVAAGRLPGRVLSADATRLPVRPESVDLVTVVWLLHLLPVAAADRVLAEAHRVLRPGGHLATTVDKDLAHGHLRRTDGDHADRVAAAAARAGLRFVGTTSFTGSTPWGSGPRGQVFPVSTFRRPR